METESERLVRHYRTLRRIRHRVGRLQALLREESSPIEEACGDAEADLAGAIRRDGPIELDGRRYSAVEWTAADGSSYDRVQTSPIGVRLVFGTEDPT